MRKEIVEGLGIKDSKKVDVKGYTTVELMYLASEAMGELDKRKTDLYNAIRNIDAELTKVVHLIEFGAYGGTDSAKVIAFNELRDLRQARRKLKQEQVINQRLIKSTVRAGETATHIASMLERVVNVGDSDYRNKINHQMPVYKQGELRKLLNKFALEVDTEK